MPIRPFIRAAALIPQRVLYEPVRYVHTLRGGDIGQGTCSCVLARRAGVCGLALRL